MKRLRRSLAVGAVALLAAACSTDSPTGMDSGLEIETMTSFAPGDLTIQVCKSWLDSEAPPNAEDGQARFAFTYTDGDAEGEVEIALSESEGGWFGPCADLTHPDGGGWSAGTELTITELTPAGVEIGRRWVVYRNGDVDKLCLAEFNDDCLDFPTDADGEPNEVEEIPASVTVTVGEVSQVFFKNAVGEPELPLEIAKTVTAFYDRMVSWELTKTVEPSSHAGGPGESFSSDWTVTATKTTAEDNFQVFGLISVTNPNGFDVAFSLSDVLNDGTVVTITCPITDDNTGTAPANGSVDCAYSASPSDASATENTATVTSDVGGGSTTEGFTWSVTVIGDDSVTLSDPRVAYSELISDTTIEVFTEIFTCPRDPAEYTDGVYMATYTNTAYLDGDNTDLEASAEVTIKCELPPGGQGCTPGFWRQDQHIQYWTGFDPSDLYADVFGVNRAGTLLENVAANGGGANALARHSVAALLNATNTEVDYDLTVAQIIAGVQAAYDSGDFESFKNVLEGFNEQGCSVDKSN